jgi:AcrR family transcriptional regulator
MEERKGSPRRAELLDAAYAYVVEHGLAGLSLRPLAKATDTSPRVLLYLFGSKDELVRELLARAREEQLVLLSSLEGRPYDEVVERLWAWLSDPGQRGTIQLFFEAYGRSIGPEPGPWDGFAEASVREWLDVLEAAQPRRKDARVRATATLALLRGLLLDLLAGGDPTRLTAALRAQ